MLTVMPRSLRSILLDRRIHRVGASGIAVIDLETAELSVVQGGGDHGLVIVRCHQQKSPAEGSPMCLDLPGDPGVYGRPVRGRVRQAEVGAVDGRRGHIPLQGGTMLRATERTLVREKAPGPGCKVAGVIGVGVGIVNLGRNKAVQP